MIRLDDSGRRTVQAGLCSGRPPAACMNELEFPSLGQTWVNLVHRTVESGRAMADEGLELTGVTVGFPAAAGDDPLLEQFGDAQMVTEMKKVFFLPGPNALGHNYAGLIHGPGGRADLADVVSLLREEPWTKRAAICLCGAPDGKVPCINTVQFLVRNAQVRTYYFARSQDAFGKFYADGLCLGLMAQKVAGGLGLHAGTVSGFIASSHVYHQDMPAICRMLAGARQALVAGAK